MKLKIAFQFILVLAVLIVTLNVLLRRNKVSDSTVRLAYSLDKGSIPVLDPAKITSFQQSVLLTNIYSRLIEYDLNGNLQSGIATKFYWQSNKLIFEFGEKVQTKSGHFIDAEDAAISIRRVLELGSSTHTNLKYFICNNGQVNDVFQNCDSIYVEEGKLVLKVQDEQHKPFIISTLAAGDFAIIPKSAIDRSDLSIVDHTETSGPYFLESKGETWVLAKNSGHYQITSSSPSKVQLIPVSGQQAAELFIDGKVDVLPTGFNISPPQIAKMREKGFEFNIFKTLPIKLYIIQFSIPALKKTTANLRFYIASQFRKILDGQYPLPIHSEPTNEFFLENGHGQLSKEQIQNLKDLNESGKPEEIKYKPSFYFYKQLREAFSVFRQIKEINPVETSQLAANDPLEERLDLFLATTDTGYEENLSLLGYNFNQGTFGYDAKEGEKWLAKYMAEEDKEKRAEMARNLQFEGLKNGVIFPMFKAPYTVLTRNGYSIDLSPIFATTNFWRIKKQ